MAKSKVEDCCTCRTGESASRLQAKAFTFYSILRLCPLFACAGFALHAVAHQCTYSIYPPKHC